jgi:hypothetical protein
VKIEILEGGKRRISVSGGEFEALPRPFPEGREEAEAGEGLSW